MIKKEYSHGEHMAQISKLKTLYDIILMIQKEVVKEKVILERYEEYVNLDKLEKTEKEYKNVK